MKLGMYAVFFSILFGLANIGAPTQSEAQLMSYVAVSIAPDGGIMTECYMSMLDGATIANYPSITLDCNRLRDGLAQGPSDYTKTPTSIYFHYDSSWQPLDIFASSSVSYLNLYYSADLGTYVDPLGYLQGYTCGPFFTNPNLATQPPLQLELCPNGQSYSIDGPSIEWSGTTSGANMPVIPSVFPSTATVEAGKTISFSAYRENSSGIRTGDLAAVTWSISPSSTAHGTISATGLYTAPTTAALGVRDLIVATGALCNICGQAETGAASVGVEPTSAPPTISVGQGAYGVCSTPTTTPQQVLIGQIIQFTGCLPASVTNSLGMGPWTPTAPDAASAIGQFTVNTVLEGTPPVENYQEILNQVTSTTCATGQPFCDYNSFYFTTPGTYTFTFTYAPGSGDPPPTPAGITFIVTGPLSNATGGQPPINVKSGLSEPTGGLPGTDNPSLVGIGNEEIDPGVYNSVPLLQAGASNLPGIVFSPQYDAGAGQYEFVQLVNSDQYYSLMNPRVPVVSGAGLDNTYPYFQNPGVQWASDAPLNGLGAQGYNGASTIYELTRSSSFTMFLMWTPPVASGCKMGGDCTIDVPIASVGWTYAASAYDTLDPVQGVNGWMLEGCSAVAVGSVITATGSQSYPVWTNTYHNTN